MINSEIVEDFDMVAKRGPTSINIDQELWKEVKKAAIDLGITATDFLEQALREKLAKRRNSYTKDRSSRNLIRNINK